EVISEDRPDKAGGRRRDRLEPVGVIRERVEEKAEEKDKSQQCKQGPNVRFCEPRPSANNEGRSRCHHDYAPSVKDSASGSGPLYFGTVTQWPLGHWTCSVSVGMGSPEGITRTTVPSSGHFQA